MIIDEEVYLAHHGVKGMKWGVRKQQAANAARATGRVAWAGTKMVGRGTKKTAIWTKEHPKQAAAIVVGAAFVAIHLRAKARQTRQGEAIAKGYKFVTSAFGSTAKAAPAAPIPRGRIKPDFKTVKKSASLIKQTPAVFRKVGRI